MSTQNKGMDTLGMQVSQYKGIMTNVNEQLNKKYTLEHNMIEGITQNSNVLFDSLESLAVKMVDEKIRNKQTNDMSWIEKNLYMSQEKEHRLKNDREFKTVASIMGIKLLGVLGKVALKKLPEINRNAMRIDIAKDVTDIFKYTEHQLNKTSDSNKTIVMSTIKSLVSDDEKFLWQTPVKKIQQRKIITDLYDFNIDSKVQNYISSEKEILGLELHKIYSNYDIKIDDIINKHKVTYELLGFNNTIELKDFLEDSQHRLSELSPIYYQNSEQGIDLLLYLASSISASVDDTLNISRELLKYDPIKESRERNMKKLKTVTKVAATVAAAYYIPAGIAPQVIRNAFSIAKSLDLTGDKEEQMEETMNELIENSSYSQQEIA